MPEIPENAKKPADRQSAIVKPEEHPDGWDLLRLPIDTEEWETADLIATLSQIKTSGESIVLSGAAIRAVGQVTKTLQLELAKNSQEFRTWIKGFSYEDRAVKVLTLGFAYMAALGEADSSAS